MIEFECDQFSLKKETLFVILKIGFVHNFLNSGVKSFPSDMLVI